MIPHVILKEVFKWLDNKSKKEARLVCYDWETEMTCSGELVIRVNDECIENLDFVQRIQNHTVLCIAQLKEQNYSRLNFDNITLQLLNCSGIYSGQFFSKVVLPCNNLTNLTLKGSLFWSLDFESGIDTSRTMRRSLFRNLIVLKLFASDWDETYNIEGALTNFYKLTGTNIRQVSKNYQFMLRFVGSQQLREVCIDDEYSKNRGSCLARKGLHWENEDLVNFLKYHSRNLTTLKLSYIPYPIHHCPKTHWTFVSPLNLKVLNISTWSEREIMLPREETLREFGNYEYSLLLPDLDYEFLEEVGENSNTPTRIFWNQTVFAQERLEDLSIASFDLWSWVIIKRVLLNNHATLRKIELTVKIDGRFDCDLFQHTKLSHLKITHLMRGLEECAVIAVHKLPLTLESLFLQHVSLYNSELGKLGKFPKLNFLHVEIRNIFNNNVFIQRLSYSSIRHLLRTRSLETLKLMRFGIFLLEQNKETDALVKLMEATQDRQCLPISPIYFC